MSVRRVKSSSQSGKSRTPFRLLLGVIVGVLSVFFSTTTAHATTISSVWAVGSAYYRGSQGIYNGSMSVDPNTPDIDCYSMQRLTSGGTWVYSGFHTGSVTGGSVDFFTVCAGDGAKTWHVVNPGAVYGLRFRRNGDGEFAVFCANQASCKALH